MSVKKNDFSRRVFLTGTLSGIASVCILGMPERELSLNSDEKTTTDPGKEIIYRILGKTGIRLPVVNMGVMNATDPELVKESYKLGVRYFDTAAWYQRGMNEQMVGKAIKELGARDDVVIGTKIYIPHNQRDMSPAEARKKYLQIAEESLERLQTDYVDILLSHSIDTLDWLKNPGILEALKLLKKKGKARFIGFSTHQNMTECINEAVSIGSYDVIETAYNYAMGDDISLTSALKKAALKGIGLIAMKTQCSQYWYRRYVSESRQKYYKGKIMHTSVLKWALRNDYITTAIPGYTTFEQMKENFSVAHDLEYTKEERKFLEDRNVKLSLGYCRQCNYCLSSCHQGVDIPSLMRAHMYATCYSNFSQARDTLDEIPAKRGLASCITCKECRAVCKNSIDIGERINNLKTMLV